MADKDINWAGPARPVKQKEVWRIRAHQGREHLDAVVVEEPLEIKIGFGKGAGRRQEALSVTMRTPGHDFELALGFLYTEGLIAGPDHVVNIRYAAEQLNEDAQSNALLVDLHPDVSLDWDKLSRHFYTTSSCGVCGKASIEMVRLTSCYFPLKGVPRLTPQVLQLLPEKLRNVQELFEKTGGIHAAGLFDPEGNLQLLREDVGRHNAVDKLIGACLQRLEMPLHYSILMVSGRASFELVQKALMAGIPVLVAVGAPSSLAIELAEENGMTLIGFLREGSCNIYTGLERIQLHETA